MLTVRALGANGLLHGSTVCKFQCGEGSVGPGRLGGQNEVTNSGRAPPTSALQNRAVNTTDRGREFGTLSGRMALPV